MPRRVPLSDLISSTPRTVETTQDVSPEDKVVWKFSPNNKSNGMPSSESRSSPSSKMTSFYNILNDDQKKVLPILFISNCRPQHRRRLSSFRRPFDRKIILPQLHQFENLIYIVLTNALLPLIQILPLSVHENVVPNHLTLCFNKEYLPCSNKLSPYTKPSLLNLLRSTLKRSKKNPKPLRVTWILYLM